MASIRSRTSAQAESAAEVSGGGRVGDPLGAQGIEVDLVVASQFEVLELLSAGQDVEGDVQHVVGLVGFPDILPPSSRVLTPAEAVARVREGTTVLLQASSRTFGVVNSGGRGSLNQVPMRARS